MAPVADVRGDCISGLIKPHRNVALDEMSGSSQAYRTTADDGNGKIGLHARSFTRFFGVAGSQVGAAHLAEVRPWPQRPGSSSR